MNSRWREAGFEYRACPQGHGDRDLFPPLLTPYLLSTYNRHMATVMFLRSIPMSRKDSRLLTKEVRAMLSKNDKPHLTRQEQEETRREVELLKKELRALMKK